MKSLLLECPQPGYIQFPFKRKTMTTQRKYSIILLNDKRWLVESGMLVSLWTHTCLKVTFLTPELNSSINISGFPKGAEQQCKKRREDPRTSHSRCFFRETSSVVVLLQGETLELTWLFTLSCHLIAAANGGVNTAL